jgi:hypothetical protein
MILCPTTTTKECIDAVCLRNTTLVEDVCVCKTLVDGCEIVMDTITDDEVCSSNEEVNLESPGDIVDIKEDKTTRKANAALIGFIVAICCIGLVIISVFVILVVGISCHNRLIMWQHRRELRRLRRERRQREARRRNEAERRRLEENQPTSSEEQVAEVQPDCDNSFVHGNDTVGAAIQERTGNEEDNVSRGHGD